MGILLKDLQEDRTYLIKYRSSLNSVTILTITEKAIQLRWNDEIPIQFTWLLKADIGIGEIYDFIEDITSLVAFNSELNNKYYSTSIVECLTCGGSGKINTDDITTNGGLKVCPRCLGSKYVMKSTKI